MMKKQLMQVLWIVALMVFLVSAYMYKLRRPLVYNYNSGNKCYGLGLYDLAESYYKTALVYKPQGKKDCKVRINLALTLIAPYTPETVTDDNLDEAIAKMKEAMEVLCENDCAHPNDTDGHDVEAQVLHDEIKAYIESLQLMAEEKQAQPTTAEEENAGGGEQTGENEVKEVEPKQTDGEPEEDETLAELREAMEAIEKDVMIDRQQEMNIGQTYGNYEYYDGECW